MGDVLLGTCSWTDKELIDASTSIRPRICRQRTGRASMLPNFPSWRSTPLTTRFPTSHELPLGRPHAPGFVFDVKAFRLFTGHWAEKSAFPRDIQQALGPAPEEKRGFYYKDVPEEVAAEAWRRFTEA